MPIQIDGITSGLDTTALIETMVSVYSIPKEEKESRISDLQDKQEKMSGLISRMGDVQTALDDIGALSDFQSFSATVLETDAISVTMSGDAVAGTYQIHVTSVAAAEMEVSDGYADKTDTSALGTGTFSLTFAGETTDITLDSSNGSLNGLASEINSIDGLTAYVMDTGDASTPYRLVVQSLDSGSSNTIEIDTSGLSGGTTPTFTEAVSAADAALTVNGVDVTADANTVTDVVPGLSIQVYEATSAPVAVTVAADPDAIEAKVQTFVDAYNEMMSYMDTNAVHNPDAELRGAFVGESSVRYAKSQLKTMVTGDYAYDATGPSGLPDGQTITSLGLAGIELDEYGTMSIDSDKFQSLLASEPEQMANLFIDAEGPGTKMNELIDGAFIDSIDGSFELRIDQIDVQIGDLEDQVDAFDRRIEGYESTLRAKFTAMESLLAQIQGTQGYISAILGSSE